MGDRVAIMSDVHGNAEAFATVLDDIRERGIEQTISIGDAVGYGPEPQRCIDLAMEHCDIILCGNHEYAVMHSADGFNPVARGAVEYVREILRPVDENDSDAHRRWGFMESLAADYFDPDNRFMAMHGSPRHPVMEYVLPSDPEVDPLKIDDIFDSMTAPVAFVGHTHYPGVVEEGGSVFRTLQELGDSYEVPTDRKVIVNVGSVGQPRDRDIRSCYVEFDGQTVWFRRVEYDVEKTVAKIQESGRLHVSLGLRLREGR